MSFVAVLLFLEFFGKQFLTYVYNTTYKEICIKDTCFDKPIDWLPKVIKKNGKEYLLGTIPTKLFFWRNNKKVSGHKYK